MKNKVRYFTCRYCKKALGKGKKGLLNPYCSKCRKVAKLILMDFGFSITELDKIHKYIDDIKAFKFSKDQLIRLRCLINEVIDEREINISAIEDRILDQVDDLVSDMHKENQKINQKCLSCGSLVYKKAKYCWCCGRKNPLDERNGLLGFLKNGKSKNTPKK